MALLTCRKCGKKFEAFYLSDEFCDACTAELADKYHEVRDYLWEHPNSTADTVAKACDCSVRQVMRWVKEERLEVSENSKVSLYCENCGMKIFSGRLCRNCQLAAGKAAEESAHAKRMEERATRMHGTSGKSGTDENGKMRYLGNRKDE